MIFRIRWLLTETFRPESGVERTPSPRKVNQFLDIVCLLSGLKSLETFPYILMEQTPFRHKPETAPKLNLRLVVHCGMKGQSAATLLAR